MGEHPTVLCVRLGSLVMRLAQRADPRVLARAAVTGGRGDVGPVQHGFVLATSFRLIITVPKERSFGTTLWPMADVVADGRCCRQR
eukprot:3679193-Prymnesium_polylepis.1